MKFPVLILLVLLLVSCDQTDQTTAPDDLTGNAITYNLYSASEFGISGQATFAEKLDGSLVVQIKLFNTSGQIFHPVHLHEGSIREDGDLATVLEPVYGESGESKSTLTFLQIDEGSRFTFGDLKNFNGSLRIHLDGGPGLKVLVAAANIGTNDNMLSDGIAVCNKL